MRTTALVFILLIVTTLSSCSDISTVAPEEENRIENHVAWSPVTVTGSSVNLRSGPGTDYSILGQVHEGDSLQVTGGLDNWYRVYIHRMSLFAWIYGPLTTGAELP